MRPLKEVMVNLGKESGEPFQVQPELAEHKVNLIFHDRTIADVMKAVSECLWLDWAPLKRGGYKLFASQALKLDIVRQFRIEQDRAARVMRARVARLSTYDRPLDDYYGKYGEAAKTLASRGDAPFAGRDNLEHVVEDLKMPLWIPIGECLNAAPGDPIAALFEEGRLIVSTNQEQQPYTMDATRFLPFATINGKAEPFVGCSCRLTWQPLAHQLTGKFLWEWKDPTVHSFGSTISLSLADKDAKPAPLESRFATWSRADDPTLLGKALNIDGVAFRMPPYRSGMASLGDHLRYLAAAADISIISDAYRVATSYGQPYTAPTVGAYMGQFVREQVKNIPLIKPGGYRSSNGWLMVRHQSFWRLDESEIPESLLKPLEQTLRQRKALTAEDYASLAVALNEEQRAAFGMDRIGLFEFSRSPLREDWSLLRLWGVLSADLRQDALGDGCSVTAFSPDAQAEFQSVLDDWAWEQSQPPDLAASVRRHGLGTVVGKLQCHVTPHSGYFDPEGTPSLTSAPKSSHYSRDVVFELALAAGRRITLGGFAEDAP